MGQGSGLSLGREKVRAEASASGEIWPGHRAAPEPDLWAIVLAGGDGVRLRDLAGKIAYPGCPKQYAVLYEGRCLLRHTLERAELLTSPERITTVVSTAHHREVEIHLVDRPPETVLAQPTNLGTGVGVLLGLTWIVGRAPAATVVILPSDHFVRETGLFVEHIRLAERAIDRFPETVP
ncbi:MAG: NTP transferase domain-containing protein [Deltaproteobacteria bacterium]|nr:NTP transferase domain-containing protein [Deltaproteobacteria bacterium]